MATIIKQAPLSNFGYDRTPVGQELMFSVSNSGIVSQQIRVKFVAEVHVSSFLPPVPGTTNHLIGTFKTTPNNAGVGIFDFRSILENEVKADNLAKSGSKYKTNLTRVPHPIHLTDKYSGNNNAMRYLFINFKVEYLDQDAASPTYNTLIQVEPAPSARYRIFNGYLKYTDILDLTNFRYGYTITPFVLASSDRSFLSNAPTIQYANVNDYGTISFLNMNGLFQISFKFYNSAGVLLGTESVIRTVANGGLSNTGDIGFELSYFGCFPGNLQNWSTVFQGLVAAGTIQGGYYNVQAVGLFGSISQSYTINVNCPKLKGYEPIRMCWLNQWGTWDYYTFTMKSIRKLSTKGSTYNQLPGTWNEGTYRIHGFKGGKKAFRVNTTEMITMNTDFVNESESEWFEELINSPEVYILKGYEETSVTSNDSLNTYVTPVRLTTSSYTRKTIANDKLMQYTFEVEKSKTLRTQSV
tara:strand:+ start:31 stop:1434 length:1404 start_codon:yes stop_codon:yes gene_type:complete